MSRIEEQLAQYRARKQNQIPTKQNATRDADKLSSTAKERTPTTSKLQQWIDGLFIYAENTRLVRAIQSSSLAKATYLKFLLWLLLYALFIQLQFGVFFFMGSLFYLMYITMTVGKIRKPGEPSAYSVFNPDFETIDGTFTAEQFERELLHGAGSVR
ncbi:SAYSvFN domain-containing protein 1-like isoform X2 [Anneissia japonica]|nr:SAYSvFN domain-containing protein 1-like isoform X2 [Anneissia japonica]XP_033125900.1 SAYSvFN domain-containing protein 1-like isoform X2 [Anneissia japonica]XP_033125901.1 SAYSvFN domain-containing protein 1-like isoform X2 [Anneissia japonica]XP_033125902.1 SAYSvFN domain-containing protein 1-like isoform X2 [Anneissia japonica]XP_033125903.1 SAYSvFN domain-containing protein 1-like isoform X2 [Anneissia japonica]